MESIFRSTFALHEIVLFLESSYENKHAEHDNEGRAGRYLGEKLPELMASERVYVIWIKVIDKVNENLLV